MPRHPRIQQYSPIDGANRYHFDNATNPGGQPTVGNAKFSLTVKAAPGTPKMSALLIGAGRQDLNVAGLRILVDNPVALPIAAGRSVTVSLPIPASRTLRGKSLNAQSVHAEAKGLGASRGLTLTIR